MPAPYSPEQFRALIVEEDDTVCTALNNLTQISVMMWRMIKFKYAADASGFTAEYGALLNEVLCPDPPVELSGDVINPTDFKGTLLGPTSSFCEMFVKLAVRLTNLIYNWVAFEYTEDGTLTDDYKSMICSLNCPEVAEEVDLSYFLNYRGFEHWDVIGAEVDLVGVDPYDPWPGNGMYVDLAGTLDASHPIIAPGVIRTKVGVPVVSGNSYRLRIDVAGFKYSASTASVRIRVFRSDLTTAILDQTVTRGGSDPFSTEQFDFVAGVTDTVFIQVEQFLGVAVGNVGPKIDDVIFENLTSGVILFSDDFSQEGPEEVAVEEVEAIIPSLIKDSIPLAVLDICVKIHRIMVDFPQAIYDWVSFEFNSSGTGFTRDYSLLICNWIQHGSGEVALPAPSGVSASDGSSTAHVQVVWGPVTPETGSVTNYRIYRAEGAITDPAAATLLATTPGNVTFYNDTSAVAGTNYRYWVRATQDDLTSDWSNSDVGYRATAAPTPTLDAISDLVATQGYYPTTTGFIRLMWTMPAGANRVNIYRSTVNDFSTASLISENTNIISMSSPYGFTGDAFASDIGQGYHLGADACIYWHLPPSGSVQYYFWVVAKNYVSASNPTQAISPESNSALGWVRIGVGDTNPTTPVEATAGPITVPVGKTKMRVLMIGAGGAASYATPTARGAGGAGGDTIQAIFTVVPADVWTFSIPQARSGTGLYVSAAPVNGPASYTEYEGRASKLEGPGTEELQAAGGLSAVYTVGTGGSRAPANAGAETYIANIVPISSTTIRGKAGQPNYENGQGGTAFGYNRAGSSSSAVHNAGDTTAAEYSGSSVTSDSGTGGGNNQLPRLLYVFSD